MVYLFLYLEYILEVFSGYHNSSPLTTPFPFNCLLVFIAAFVRNSYIPLTLPLEVFFTIPICDCPFGPVSKSIYPIVPFLSLLISSDAELNK